MNLITFLLIAASVIIVAYTEVTCEGKTCFDCASISKCKWNIDKCEEGKNENGKWYLKYGDCENDSSSLDIMNEYCFSVGSSNMIPVVATLIQVNDKYARPNLFCKWVINVPDNSNPIFLNATKSSESRLKNDKYVIQYEFNDNNPGSSSSFEIDSYYLKSSIVKKITFSYYSPEGSHLDQPFLVSVDFDKSMTIVDIVIVVVVVILSVIVVIIVIITGYHCIKYIRLKRKNRLNNPNISHQIQSDQIQVNNYNQNNKKQLIELLKPVACEAIYLNNGRVCTICFEELAIDTPIILLKCTHIFHATCMTDYIDKAKKGPRCPNCNIDLIENKKESLENIPLNPNNIPTERDHYRNNNNTNRVQIYNSNVNNIPLNSNNNILLNNIPANNIQNIPLII